MATQARQRLIDSAVALTRVKGVAGTTVAELLSHSGVARRSLYLHFTGGREDLLAEALSEAGAQMSDGLAAVLADAPFDEALDAFIGAMRANLTSGEFRAGCPILQAALGGGDVPAVSRVAGRTMSAWREAISARLSREGVPAERARSLAHMIVSSTEGAVAMGVATESTQPLDDVRTHLLELLQNATAAPTSSSG